MVQLVFPLVAGFGRKTPLKAAIVAVDGDGTRIRSMGFVVELTKTPMVVDLLRTEAGACRNREERVVAVTLHSLHGGCHLERKKEDDLKFRV